MLSRSRLVALGFALSTVFVIAAQGPDQSATWEPYRKRDAYASLSPSEFAAYSRAIRLTAAMAGDSTAGRLAQRHGLSVLNLTWEDAGRYKNSAVGPNISDMTIQVALEEPSTRRTQVTCMPVVRYPNFSDKTCDLDPRDFTLLVGNEKGRPLKRISLYDFLEEPIQYLTNPQSWRSPVKTLVAPRDRQVLVSAQACFLPVPPSSKATFNPVLFNYQSVSGDPAVLTVLATREGTSVTVIDNKRDAFSEGSAWGQRLFFNQAGQRASLTGERLSDFRNHRPNTGAPVDNKTSSGLNMALLIQIPLKQKYGRREAVLESPAAFGGMGGGGKMKKADLGSNVEAAVLGHGRAEGPFTEIDNLAIQRDPAFPVRVTVQFYKATSNGVASPEDMRQIKQEIDGIYANSDSVGSLVVAGETGRITEYAGAKVQPIGWWEAFWRRHEANTGDGRTEAIAKLRKLLGNDFMQRPVCELYLRDVLRAPKD